VSESHAKNKTSEKSRSRIKVPDMRKNLVPDTQTTDRENALLELGPCFYDKSCAACRRNVTLKQKIKENISKCRTW